MATPDPKEVEEYQYLWTTRRNDYLLVCDKDEPRPVVVDISRRDPEIMVFSDNEFGAAVKQRMKEAGIPIVTWEEMEESHEKRRGNR